jgi:signal recognition particle receptor subunit beta
MALFNYATKEITIKVVYYGPGLSGKTTNLQYLHTVFEPAKRGKLLSLATEADRTLFFDFLPIHLGKISDFSIRFQLYTVPGQVRYNATRRLVLKGADAIVFVADSQREMSEQNIESLANMKENLIANNINPDDIPVTLQYNKRDLVNILSVDQLNKELNENAKYDVIEAVAINGTGVEETFQHITRLVIKGISEKHKIKVQPVIQPAGVATEEKPKEESIVEGITLPDMEIEQTRYDAVPATKNEIIHTAVFEEPSQPKEPVVEHVKEIKDMPVISPEKESKEIRDTPVFSTEQIKVIVDGLGDLSSALTELKRKVSDVQAEIREIRKEQKEARSNLREISSAMDNIRTKRKWFSFP